MTDDSLRRDALTYHETGRPGKLAIRATKPMNSQRDLALAYSPGVAAACEAIVDDPANVSRYTARGNMVAVITNGSAVLGLGNIGALASKPVMEGKAVLFKKFADIDVFDIEIDESDPKALIDTIRRLEPTFGAINLEDIKSPECFEVEQTLRQQMRIPVFHDDQHGTAIVTAAAVLNALRIVKKPIEAIKIVSTGGGAAGIACLDLLLSLGAKRENVFLCDLDGLVYAGRGKSTPQKDAYAQPTGPASLDDVIGGADLFLGLSGPGVLKPAMVAKMADQPVILAMANPTPEILPDEAKAVRPDAIVATGRSDFPNQVNNVLCFPFIFRGALDVGATQINEEMKLACVRAIADLAHAASADEVARAYRGERLVFGPEYLIPKPFDPRLLEMVAPAVAKAAMDSGVATRPIADFEAYRHQLSRFVYRSSFLMKPLYDKARATKRRIVFAEGEDERVLRAAQTILDDGLGVPILVGRPAKIAARCADLGLRIRPDADFEALDVTRPDFYEPNGDAYHGMRARDGVTPAQGRKIMRTNDTAAAAMHVRAGNADAMVCGCYGQYLWHMRYVAGVLGGAKPSLLASLTPIILDAGAVFIADGFVNYDPSAEALADIAVMAAEEVRRFGETPRVAFVSHTNFGANPSPSARKLRAAVELLDARGVDFEYEGEMRVNAAISKPLRDRFYPGARLSERANVLITPGMDAANIMIYALSSMANGQIIGPILMGLEDHPAHIVTPTVTVRGLLNVAALAGS